MRKGKKALSLGLVSIMAAALVAGCGNTIQGVVAVAQRSNGHGVGAGIDRGVCLRIDAAEIGNSLTIVGEAYRIGAAQIRNECIRAVRGAVIHGTDGQRPGKLYPARCYGQVSKERAVVNACQRVVHVKQTVDAVQIRACVNGIGTA